MFIDNSKNKENNVLRRFHNCAKKFLLISTDKVVNPSSWMGKTKLEAEKNVLNSNLNKKNKLTSLSVIIFGNIIGSRGSVLPKFLNQIKSNENLTVTHKNMTRFFITIDFAVNKIIDSLNIMNGGEIFIINNMKSLKIYDLTYAIKKYLNFKKKIIISGLREGEKLYEELATNKEMKKSKVTENFIILFNKRKNIKEKDLGKHMVSSLNSKKAKFINKKQILTFLIQSKLL